VIPRGRPVTRAPSPKTLETEVAEKEQKIEFDGEVLEHFKNGMYKIALENGHEALGYTAGKMRRYRIRILPGDKVKLELSPYDLNRGRIVYRYRDGQ
jgi:translation initiation factor IF-1